MIVIFTIIFILFLIMASIYRWLDRIYKNQRLYVTLLCVSLLPLIMFAFYTLFYWMNYDYEEFKTNMYFAIFFGSPILIPDLILLCFSLSKLSSEDSEVE